MLKKISILKIFSIILIIVFLAINEFLISSIALAIGGKKTLGIMMEEKMKKIFPQPLPGQQGGCQK